MTKPLSTRDWLLSDLPTSRRQAKAGHFYRIWLAFKANKLAMVGLGIVALLLAAAILAPLIAPYNPRDRRRFTDRAFAAAKPNAPNGYGRASPRYSKPRASRFAAYPFGGSIGCGHCHTSWAFGWHHGRLFWGLGG